MLKIRIKKARLVDVDFIVDVSRENMFVFIDWNDDLFREKINIKNIEIAWLNNKRIALLDTEIISKSCYIHNLQVEKKYQRLGVGKLLIDNLIKRIKKNGDVCFIEIKVFSKNKVALDFYKKIGFIKKCILDDGRIALVFDIL